MILTKRSDALVLCCMLKRDSLTSGLEAAAAAALESRQDRSEDLLGFFQAQAQLGDRKRLKPIGEISEIDGVFFRGHKSVNPGASPRLEEPVDVCFTVQV